MLRARPGIRGFAASSRRVARVLVLAALAWPAGALRAAPPENDAFASAVALEGAWGVTSGNNFGATKEDGELNHAGVAGGASVWWRWRAPAAGRATLHTRASNFDTLLSVYTGTTLASLRVRADNDDATPLSQSQVDFSAVAGVDYLIAVDGYERKQGWIQLVWHLDPEVGVPANDAFAARELLSGDSGILAASARRASIESSEPDHANAGSSKTLWWRWVAPAAGVASFQTRHSSFNTLLVLYRGSRLEALAELGSDDNSGEAFSSQVVLRVNAGEELAMVVGDAGEDDGVVFLTWKLLPGCQPPGLPALPSPADGGTGVATDATLEWSLLETGARNVIYGEDNRVELFELTDPRLLAAADATVALIRLDKLDRTADGGYHISSQSFAAANNLCPTEPYRDQPVPSFCSGFLVGPDLVATAGHCVESNQRCAGVAFVFGFRMLDAATAAVNLNASQVYFCREIVMRQDDDVEDWALVRLDRTVPDHQPLALRRSGSVAQNQQVFVVGHPSGLPAKLAGNAFVRDISSPRFFDANLDTYSGNSGSPVINADTFLVEGILVRGEDDFESQGPCVVSKRCADAECEGESASRASEFDFLVPPHPGSLRYRLLLAPCDEPLAEVGAGPTPRWSLAGLRPGTAYCWRVVVESECGPREGPVWSFTTGSGEGRAFRRGELNGDGQATLTDAIAILTNRFLGTPLPVDCPRAMDMDDDGRIAINDPILLLTALFIGGEPAPPYRACGVDTTPDDLGCAEFPLCPGG